VLLVVVFCTGQDYNVSFQRRAAAAGGDYFSDDFEDNLNDWTAIGGTWSVDNGEARTNDSGVMLWTVATTTKTQWGCVMKADAEGGVFAGVYLRASEFTSSTNGYAARWNGEGDYRARACDPYTSCSDIGDPTVASSSDGKWHCAEVEGETDATILRFWYMAAVDPCLGEGTEPDDWGDPDECWCDGGSCSGCDCGVDTVCYDSVGSGCTDPGPVSCLDGTPDYANCGANCYIGLYNGSSQDARLDNFCGGST